MDKVRVIELSLRCRRIAWWCLVPLAGVIAIVSVFNYRRKIRAEVGDGWNPAAGALRLALALAIIGILITLATVVIVIFVVPQHNPFG